ncbi:hypothetical protein [Paucibacter sp. KBW04]|uniref:hypothetical protein n=1 Tax=Paucibacter sp. KBW04 TaxID=2153361 RepID=UPI000F56C5BC|nr:hypothetical protein [Paucibacter sp. KBW04]
MNATEIANEASELAGQALGEGILQINSNCRLNEAFRASGVLKLGVEGYLLNPSHVRPRLAAPSQSGAHLPCCH